MLNLLIVEDEYLARTELQEDFEWSSVGFTVCGAARDGEEALAVIRAGAVDVVLTDIKMPRIDGLALIAAIRQIDSSIRCVIFSGYDRFEYARQAMAMGVNHYLLKPLNAEELSALFGKLRLEIIGERLRLEQEGRMRRILESSSSDLAEKTLQNYLVTRKGDLETTLFLLRHFGYLRPGDGGILALADAEYGTATVLEERLVSFCRDSFERRAVVFGHSGMTVLFLALPPADGEAFEARLQGLCQEHSLRVLLAEGELSSLPMRLRGLLHRAENRFYLDFGGLYPCPAHSEDPPKAPAACVGQTVDWAALIRGGSGLELTMALRRYERMLLDGMPPRDLAVIASVEGYTAAAAALSEDCPGIAPMRFEEIYSLLGGFDAFRPMMRCFADQILALARDYHERKDSRGSVIGHIQSYIGEHYGEDLSIAALAARYYFHPSYLGSLFFKKTGISLKKYVKTVRLRKAKELLASTQRSVADIAKSVGFSDYRYFCNSFRSEFQLTPLEYRASRRMPAKEDAGK